MLEKMGEFFDNRLDEYEEHQLNCIEGAIEFYPYTATCLPKTRGAYILDLGCGTGLELNEYFSLNPYAKVMGIDLAEGMLNKLKEKFVGKDITLILGSYFDIAFGENIFDAAVSVESLHHFTIKEKTKLYTKLRNSLKDNGYFIITDYFSLSDEEEQLHKQELNHLKSMQGISDNEFYHFDTPLTLQHEKTALLTAGFSSVDVLKKWGATYTLKATK